MDVAVGGGVLASIDEPAPGRAARSLAALVAASLVLVAAPVARAAAPSPCARVSQQHPGDFFVVFDPPSGFTLCRDGHAVDDVIAGHRTFVELLAEPVGDLYRYRVRGQGATTTPTGLRTAEERLTRLAQALHHLAESQASIAELEPPATGSPTRVATARQRYLGVTTARFHTALAEATPALGEIAGATELLDRWCTALRPVDAAVVKRCAAVAKQAPELRAAGSKLAATLDEFRDARDRAREALLDATGAPSDNERTARAVAALDEAHDLVTRLTERAHALSPKVTELAQAAMAIRDAERSLDALRPGVPVLVSGAARAGTAVLAIEVELVGAIPAPDAAPPSLVTFRYVVTAAHYVDLEAGLGFTGGLPQIPSLVSDNGTTTIRGRDVDQFVALALVELEPARFLWPDRPLAGLLRFPVVGIPLSRDPTESFFVGAGLGWTGVGSIVVGPYLLREQALRGGYGFGETVPQGTTLDAVVRPVLNVGYFISASVDLVGLFRLFVPAHPPTYDAATGREQ